MGSYSEQQKQSKYNRQATQLQQQQAALEAARRRRDMIRQARLAKAQSAVVTESQGISDSSVATGQDAGFVSALNANLSFLDQSQVINDQTQTALGKAQKAAEAARTYGAIGDAAVAASSIDWSKLNKKK